MEKIKSPKSGYMITVGGKTYNQLIKEGYLGGKVKSPTSNRLISVDGKTYKKLYEKGHFVKITGLKELDEEILLNLSLNDLRNIQVNVYLRDLMNEAFWCKWIDQHYAIKTETHCKIIAKTLSIDNKDKIYDIALKKGYTPLVNYLLENKLVDPLVYKLKHYSHLEPIQTAVQFGHLEIVKLLLSYDADRMSALYRAVSNNQVHIVRYLLEHYTYEDLSEVLETATRHSYLDIMNMLIEYDADPETAIIAAIHSDNIDILKYILSFNPNIPNDAIAIALGLRKYDMLKLLIPNIANIDHDQLETLLLPNIHNQALYYEVKYKW